MLQNCPAMIYTNCVVEALAYGLAPSVQPTSTHLPLPEPIAKEQDAPVQDDTTTLPSAAPFLNNHAQLFLSHVTPTHKTHQANAASSSSTSVSPPDSPVVSVSHRIIALEQLQVNTVSRDLGMTAHSPHVIKDQAPLPPRQSTGQRHTIGTSNSTAGGMSTDDLHATFNRYFQLKADGAPHRVIEELEQQIQSCIYNPVPVSSAPEYVPPSTDPSTLCFIASPPKLDTMKQPATNEHIAQQVTIPPGVGHPRHSPLSLADVPQPLAARSIAAPGRRISAPLSSDAASPPFPLPDFLTGLSSRVPTSSIALQLPSGELDVSIKRGPLSSTEIQVGCQGLRGG